MRNVQVWGPAWETAAGGDPQADAEEAEGGCVVSQLFICCSPTQGFSAWVLWTLVDI